MIVWLSVVGGLVVLGAAAAAILLVSRECQLENAQIDAERRRNAPRLAFHSAFEAGVVLPAPQQLTQPIPALSRPRHRLGTPRPF